MTRAAPTTHPVQRAVVRVLPVSYPDDASLARALVAGQAMAAAAVWDRFAPLVRALLLQTLGPDQEIDDLTQDTFLALLRHISTLREPALLKSFLVGIAVRVARRELRRRRLRRWLSLTSDGELPAVAASDADLVARAELRELYRVLDKLHPDARLLFVLRHAEGLELHEIARHLECSLATAKRRLAQANARVLVHARSRPELLERLGKLRIEEAS